MQFSAFVLGRPSSLYVLDARAWAVRALPPVFLWLVTVPGFLKSLRERGNCFPRGACCVASEPWSSPVVEGCQVSLRLVVCSDGQLLTHFRCFAYGVTCGPRYSFARVERERCVRLFLDPLCAGP